MSICRRDGSRPDVDEPKTPAGSLARQARASRSRFRSSLSGALSCTKSAPATAASTLSATSSLPSAGRGIIVSFRHARRAFSSISATLRPASGSGSYNWTSMPWSRKRAAQPPPMTPPPRSPTRRGLAVELTASVTLLQAQLGSNLVWAEDSHIHALEDADGAFDELAIRRQLSAREVDVVLEADPHVAARQHRHPDVGELHAPDREGREHRSRWQLPDHAHQSAWVVGRTVGNPHAELDHWRIVDQALTHELFDHHEVACVEDLQLGADPEGLHPAGRGSHYRGAVGPDVV